MQIFPSKSAMPGTVMPHADRSASSRKRRPPPWYHWRLHLKECPNTFEMSTAREDDTGHKLVNSLPVYTVVTASWLGMPAHNCIPRGKTPTEAWPRQLVWYIHVKSMKSYQLLERPEETPSLWEAIAGNGCLCPSSRCVKELRSTCTAPIGGSVMEVHPSPSRPNPISIPCFRWWSSRTLTTRYVT
jgi:hypothetical protein